MTLTCVVCHCDRLFCNMLTKLYPQSGKDKFDLFTEFRDQCYMIISLIINRDGLILTLSFFIVHCSLHSDFLVESNEYIDYDRLAVHCLDSMWYTNSIPNNALFWPCLWASLKTQESMFLQESIEKRGGMIPPVLHGIFWLSNPIQLYCEIPEEGMRTELHIRQAYVLWKCAPTRISKCHMNIRRRSV